VSSFLREVGSEWVRRRKIEVREEVSESVCVLERSGEKMGERVVRGGQRKRGRNR
jgi:hypothetical protein